ncbi:unnamed protein product [Adineta steineri]|nr:unnamed protein product [Adineta steineri]
MEQKIGDEEIQSERVGYVPDPLSNLTDYTTSDTIPIHNSSVLDVNGCLVSSDEIANYVLHKLKNNKTHEQMNSERVHLIPHSSKPVNEYYNPKLLVGLYPTLFCYGRGAPDDQSRPVKTNLREHIRYLLSYNDRRFETNHSFIFVVFNILQRRNACFHAQLITTKPHFRDSAQDIQTLNSKDIETALKNISKKTYNSESNSALNKLLNHIKTIGGRVMGSAYSRTALRTRIHSLIYNQCLPNIFLTLNPADIHSPIALYFAGVKLNLDNIQMEQLLNTYKRAEIIASHPVATAKFFHLLITNIVETIIVDGVLGPIKAYFGTVESQGRGSLHLHLLIWLDHDMKPADMKEQVQNSTFREKLKAYLEDIIKEDLDEFKDKYVFENSDASRSFNSPTQLSRDNIYAALRTIDLVGLEENTNEYGIQSTPMKEQSSPSIPYASPPNLHGSPSIPYASPPNLHGSPSIPYASPPNLHGSPSIPYASPSNLHSSPSNLHASPSTSYGSSPRNTSLQTPTHGRSKSVDNVLHNQSNVSPACLPTPNPSSPNFASRFRADVVRVVEASNIHNHTDTCYKYCNTSKGLKQICRMRMPRKLVAVSTIDPETGHISMRRSHPMINNFNEYIISACRSNMDIKFIWTGSDAKALVYYITDYVTKMSLSFHDTFALVQKGITSMNNSFHQPDNESAIEKSRKLILRCYNTLASQQELSGAQVASYLMNWEDHYTTHKFQGLFLIQTELFLQSELNEIRTKQKSKFMVHDVIDDYICDDEAIDDQNNDEEQFQIQISENDEKHVLVNTRINYQYRSETLNNICLYDFVSILYKKKMNTADLKYLSNIKALEKQNDNRKGRPPNERYAFQKQHPQATTYVMMKYTQSRVPILYGPQIPRQDRDDTRERYCRALLTLFVPWRSVADLCAIEQTWDDAFKSRQHLISTHSMTIIENIQLLHECKKDRDEHLLQVIAEAQTDDDAIDPVFLPANQDIYGDDEFDDNEDLLELLSSLDEHTTAAMNSTKKSTENKYIEETIQMVENVGRFSDIHSHIPHHFNEVMDDTDQQIVPFVSATPNLVRLNAKWQEQLKTEKERVRRNLITGNYDKTDDTLDYDSIQDALVTMVNSNNYNINTSDNYTPILPVASITTTSYSTQKSIIDEYTLNREQQAAFMIISSHLDGDKERHKGTNNGQLLMCIPGCGGTGKSQLIRAVTKYFLITKRMQMMRKLAPTGIAAAEIGGMTIHSFLGEQRNSGKPRTIKPGDTKLEKQWRLVEYLLIDEMSMVGLTLLGKLNRILSAAKHVDPQIAFGGINVIFFGDYLQYRPVYDAPLYTDFSQPSKTKSSTVSTEREIQQRAARSLILQINCVIKLSKQMRTEDERYRQLLERLREGECNQEDYELLLTRVVGQPSVSSLRESPWNEAPILAYRNEVRTQLNNKAAVHNAAQLGYQPMVCVAQDSCQGKPIEDPILMKKLLELSDSKTEHLPGLLPFVPGMPVILTQNLAIELGLINGINGIFRQLVYEDDSVSIGALSRTFPNNTQYVHRPLYALIEIARSKIECNLETLQPKIVPIPLMEQTFRFDVTDILPKNKKPKSNRKAMLSIKRRALPLVPAYCITTHKSQGQTLSKAVIDLKLPNETEDIAAVYVPLSRLKGLVDVAILRHFEYKVLRIKPSKSQVAEIERLNKLYIDTQFRFPEYFQ